MIFGVEEPGCLDAAIVEPAVEPRAFGVDRDEAVGGLGEAGKLFVTDAGLVWVGAVGTLDDAGCLGAEPGKLRAFGLKDTVGLGQLRPYYGFRLVAAVAPECIAPFSEGVVGFE